LFSGVLIIVTRRRSRKMENLIIRHRFRMGEEREIDITYKMRSKISKEEGKRDSKG